MKKAEQQQKELDKLIQKCIDLKNHLYGEGNWNTKFLHNTIDGCKGYIQYCKEQYGVI